MLDRTLRRTKDRLLGPVVGPVSRAIGPAPITALSFATCLGAAGAAGKGWTAAGVILWLTGRGLDGLDGAVARRLGQSSDLGGYFDMLLDTIGYAAVPLAIALHADRRATWIALAVLLVTFYVNAISWAYLSAILEKQSLGAATTGESTTVTMPTGLIEGTETIAFYAAFLLWPANAPALFGAMAAGVAISVIQRAVWATKTLR